ncbi:unnamed protein product [Didymodactylos carnosus]|uniref:Uncharacterized protein n=1 Tax=Didymodactylos carnosus TaxID=1234261 RepID=A0A815NBZ5_9BILA|nr:unnamed protein product [Didymodactylos carnosus]CAF1436183.1 unnamed protein product [Didymodactylos carnosus]CAF4055937.1 unnamed protein product [Didymodactylos carnosus]CAF4313662.1 unnamed protein product [Didymodactylos carnosus]
MVVNEPGKKITAETGAQTQTSEIDNGAERRHDGSCSDPEPQVPLFKIHRVNHPRGRPKKPARHTHEGTPRSD